MSIWWLVLPFVISCISSAEEHERPGKPSPTDLVSHAVNSPLSAEQVEERVFHHSDGSSTIEVVRSRVYRDSVGRMTIEGSAGSPNESTLFMIDPTSGARTLLLVRDKIAYRIIGPKVGEDGFVYGAGGMGEALPPGKWTARTENLGRRIIDGIEVEGERITQISADQPPLVAVYDRWYSGKLRSVVLAVASGPYGRHTARIQNLRREEPDPALFTIAPGYNIIDIGSHSGQ